MLISVKPAFGQFLRPRPVRRAVIPVLPAVPVLPVTGPARARSLPVTHTSLPLRPDPGRERLDVQRGLDPQGPHQRPAAQGEVHARCLRMEPGSTAGPTCAEVHDDDHPAVLAQLRYDPQQR